MTDTHEKLMETLRRNLPGIAQDECGGDNLSILLVGHFEPGIEDDELDEFDTWKQGSVDAANRVLDAIHNYYLAALSQAHQDGIREGKRQAAGLVFNATITTRHHPHDAYVEQPVMHREVLSAMILSTITDESE